MPVVRHSWVLAAACAAVSLPSAAFASSYASGVQISGQTVNFTLNEPASSLTVSINNGQSLFTLDGTTAGSKSFSIPSATTPFSIVATSTSGNGYLQGTALQAVPDNTNTRFFGPRGVAVNQNPNSPFFGRAYVASGTAGTTGTGSRATGKGLYLINADGSSAVGQGDTALTGTYGPTFTAGTVGQSPFRVEVGPDSNLYVSDAGSGTNTTNGGVYRFGPNVAASDGEDVLFGKGYDAASLAANLHGRIYSSPVVLPSATPGSLTLYATDGDYNTPAGSFNSLRQYTISATGSAAAAITPTLISKGASGDAANPGIINTVAAVLTDVARGKDGKFYMMQNRANGGEAGLMVISGDGSTVLFNSLAATKALNAAGDATADGSTTLAGIQDLLITSRGVAVSPDGKTVALIRDDNGLMILPLVDGVPDLSRRKLITGTAAFGTATTIGRDVSFDAVGNLYAVSSGAELLRIFSPGGFSQATTSFDGSTISFSSVVPEPSVAGLALAGAACGLLRRRRQAARA